MTQQTALYEEHLKENAKMIDFGGWMMPVSYKGITEEHMAVRQKAGIFDIGHMGIFSVEGTNALDFLQKTTTNDVSVLQVGQIQYSMICNDEGGVIDDILVYRLPEKFMVVANASNTQKVKYWLEKNKKDDVILTPMNHTHSMLAIQGPEAESILARIVDTEISQLKYYWFTQASVLGKKSVISRTGYTGEDGFEIIVPKDEVAIIWKYLIKNDIQPCGLGARDTLRIEAGMPLYGHELSEEKSPIVSHLKWAVKFTKEFIGKKAIEKDLPNDVPTKLAGIEMLDRAIPRHGYEIKEGGIVTSGTFSPLLKKPIGIVMIDKEMINTTVTIIIRGKEHKAKVVDLPFYKRK